MFFPFLNYENEVAKKLMKLDFTVSVAESCTGGLISSLLTDVSGSSSFVKSNFVTYANDAKMKYLFVKENTLKEFGAVSEQTAQEMVVGLLQQAKTDVALSITGIAGPSGGSAQKPVGLCFVGIAYSDKVVVEKVLVSKFLPRKIIKFLFAKKALMLLIKFLKEIK